MADIIFEEGDIIAYERQVGAGEEATWVKSLAKLREDVTSEDLTGTVKAESGETGQVARIQLEKRGEYPRRADAEEANSFHHAIERSDRIGGRHEEIV